MASLNNAYNGFDKRTPFYDSLCAEDKCPKCNNNLTYINKEYDLEQTYRGFPNRSSIGVLHVYKLIYKCNNCNKIIKYTSYQ